MARFPTSALLAAVAAAIPAAAAARPAGLTCAAEAPSAPERVYAADEAGRVLLSRDGGGRFEEVADLGRRTPAPASDHAEGWTRRWFPGLGTLDVERSLADAMQVFDPADVRSRVPLSYQRVRGLAGGLVSRAPSTGIPAFLRPTSLPGRVRGLLDDALHGDGFPAAPSDPERGPAAPRLAAALADSFGGPRGVSLRAALDARPSAGPVVVALDVHPQDPDDVLAATTDGVWRARDGGLLWMPALGGDGIEALPVRRLARDPRRAERIYAATAQGLFVSHDAGASWLPFRHEVVAGADTRAVALHAADPQTFYVALADGLARTRDGGRSFEQVLALPSGGEGEVQDVALDAADPRRVVVAAGDHLLVSRDGGDTWRVPSGWHGMGVTRLHLAAGPRAGQLVAAAGADLWETRDGGASWQAASFGGAGREIRAVLASARPAEGFLLVTPDGVARIAAGPQPPAPPHVEARFRTLIESEPGLREAVAVALERAGVAPDEIAARQRRARWTGAVPALDLGLGWRSVPVVTGFGNPLQFPDQPLLSTQTQAVGRLNMLAVARWDLADLVFGGREVEARRTTAAARALEDALRATVARLFEERRRLQYEALLGASDLRAGLMRDLRLEELTAHLNVLTGDLFAPSSAL